MKGFRRNRSCLKALIQITLLIFISACSSGGSSHSNGAVAVNKRLIEAGNACPNGGIEIDMGVDSDANGQLDASEVTSTELVCNGQSSLVELIRSSDPGCPYGGTDIQVGLDDNGNGKLDFHEILNTTLICHAQNSVVAGEFSFSPKGTVSGVLDLSLVPLPKTSDSRFQPQSRAMLTKFETRQITEQAGKLWLTPNEVAVAIQADQAAVEQAELHSGSATSITPPVIIPLEVSVAADGTYSIDVPAGTGYSLNYVNANATQAIKVNDVNVSPNQTTNIIIIPQDLTATGSVVFSVGSLANNSPVANASVTLLDDATTIATDLNGQGSFEGLAAGSYTLLVQQTGYVPQTFTAVIKAGEFLDLGVLQLSSEKGFASGTLTVNTELLTSLENIVVHARDARGGIYTTLTDVNGGFNFPVLPVGDGYTFIVQANDFAVNKIDNVSILPNEETEVGSIALQPSSTFVGAISGYAKFSNLLSELNAHAGIVVAVEGTDKEAITSRDGAFILNGLVAGRYTLNFTDSNYQTRSLENIRVVASSTAPLNPVVMQLKTGQVNGIVALNGQIGAAGILVEILDSPYSTYTDNSGRWHFDLPIGNYGGGIRYSADLFGSDISVETVTVTENGSYNAAPTSLYQQAIRTTIPLTASAACSDLSIHIEGGDSTNYDSDVIAVNGIAMVDLPFGEYLLLLQCADSGFESIYKSLTVSENGQTQTTLSPVNLRTRYVLINSREEVTNDNSIVLTLGAGDATEMRLFDDVNDTGWVPFEANYDWVLSNGDGQKLITVEYRNTQGSLGSENAQITLDTGIIVSSFTATGASSKGDYLTLLINLNDDLGASVHASYDGLFSDLAMLDNGLAGDVIANDGIYTRVFSIASADEFSGFASASITDAAGNNIIVNSNSVSIATAPTISQVITQSDLTTGQLAIRFITDELTTTSIKFGDAPASLSAPVDVSSNLERVHNILLSELSSNELVYYQLTASDGSSNTSTKSGFVKLAPSSPLNVSIQAGDGDLGVVWDVQPYLYIAGYNVYRSEDNASWLKANSNGVLGTPYFYDTSVVNNQTYYYKVASVDTGGNESITSEVVSATPSSAFAGPTRISNTELFGNQIWLASMSPVELEGDVAAYGTSRIWGLPGTEIIFKNPGRLLLDEALADLYLLGTPSAPLKISSEAGRLYSSHIVIDDRLKYDDPSATLAARVRNRATDARGYLAHGVYARNIEIKNAYIDLNGRYSGAVYSLVENVLLDGISPQQSILVAHTVVNATNNDQQNSGSDHRLWHTIDATILKNSTLDSVIDDTNYVVNSHLTNISGRNSGTLVKSFLSIVPGGYSEKSLIIDSVVSGHMRPFSGRVINSDMSDVTCGSTFSSTSNAWFGSTDKAKLMETGCFSESKPDSFMGLRSHADPGQADFDQDGIVDMLDADRDGDGVPDWQELQVQPSGSIFDETIAPVISLVDTDYDGIEDAVDSDDDNDGVADAEELSAGTDHLIKDSDMDGVDDWVEITYGYDPLNADHRPLTQSNSYSTVLDDSFVINGNEVVVVHNEKSEGEYFGTRILTLRDMVLTDAYGYTLASKTDLDDSSIRGGATIEMSKHSISNGTDSGRLDCSGYNRCTLENIDFGVVGLQLSEYASVMNITAGQYEGGSLQLAGYVENSLLGKQLADGSVSAAVSGNFVSNHNRVITYGDQGKAEYVSSYWSSFGSGFSDDNQLVIRDSVVDDGSFGFVSASNTEIGFGQVYGSILRSVYLSKTGTDDPSQLYKSDIYWEFPYVLYDYATFFSNSYLVAGETAIGNLGMPIDQLGDGQSDTAIDFIDIAGNSQILMIDGLTQPKASANFPGGDGDLWNGLGVGAR